jgi:Na+/H+ antiporter NhaD/arsenite permease-like protein
VASILPALILAIVVAALLLRNSLKLPVSPWQLMVGGAILALLAGSITVEQALSSIDWSVLLFLYGMFVLSVFLEESFYLEYIGYELLRHFENPFAHLLAIVFSIGIASAFLLNDTIAIIGVPLCLLLAQRSGIKSAPLLVALALAVTIGSVFSPLGNPQNYLIAKSSAFHDAFTSFFLYLGPPAILSLLFLGLLLWAYFPQLRLLKKLSTKVSVRSAEFHASQAGILAVLGLSILRALASAIPIIPKFDLFWIAIAGAAVPLALTRNWKNLVRVDWQTLLLFTGMFVLTESVWLSGFFQQFLPHSSSLSDPGVIVLSSLFLSQVLSNVPFVIFYLKALGETATAPALLLLAAGSTLAGCLTLIGAASNLIILQSAEKRGEKFPMLDFMIAGFISTAASLAFIFAWMKLLGAL